MTIHRERSFFVDVDREGRLSIGIESNKLAACIAEAKRRRAYGVFGHFGFRFRQDNLDFLTSLPNIRRIWFWDIKLKSIDGIYALKNLREFGVHPKRPGIDFARLGKLEEITWKWNLKDTGLGSLKRLRKLYIWHYNPKHRSFEGLTIPKSIVELQINWANPKSLAGLPELPKLKRLEIACCRNLETIRELFRIAPNLEHLVVSNCGRVADGPAAVRHLRRLQHAYVRDAVLVTR